VFPVKERHNTLAFVGCIEPSGPVAPAIELQSRWVARVFSKRASIPDSIAQRQREMRQRRARDLASMGYAHLLRPDSRGDWTMPPTDDPIVESLGRKSFPLLEYQEDLASLIGCRPPLLRLFFSDHRLCWRLIFGPCHPASYRLVGPGCWRGARNAIFSAINNTENSTRTRIAAATSTSAVMVGGWSRWWPWFALLLVLVLGSLLMRRRFFSNGYREEEEEEENVVSTFLATVLDSNQ